VRSGTGPRGDIRVEVLRELNMEVTLCWYVSACNLVDFSRYWWALEGQQTLKLGQVTGKLSWVVTVLMCVQEVPVSKLGLDPDHRDIFVVLLSSRRQMPEQCLKLCNGVRSTSFRIHLFTVIQLCDSVLSQLLAASSVN
jgi:hypothetical protein